MGRVVHNPRMYELVFSPSSFDFIFFYTNLGKGKELIRTKKRFADINLDFVRLTDNRLPT